MSFAWGFPDDFVRLCCAVFLRIGSVCHVIDGAFHFVLICDSSFDGRACLWFREGWAEGRKVHEDVIFRDSWFLVYVHRQSRTFISLLFLW